jgi:hypothetical protein
MPNGPLDREQSPLRPVRVVEEPPPVDGSAAATCALQSGEAEDTPAAPPGSTAENRPATREDVMEAWRNLLASKSELAILHKNARWHALGSQRYHCAHELICDALGLAYVAAVTGGKEGRVWRLNVPFVAFMIMTVKGLAADAHKGAYERRGVALETVPEQRDDRDPLALLLAQEQDEEQARTGRRILKEVSRRDPRIGVIIKGLLKGLSPSEIRKRGQMTEKGYANRRRNLLRMLAELRPAE